MLQNMQIDAYLKLLAFTLGISLLMLIGFMIADRLFIRKVTKNSGKIKNCESAHFGLKGACIFFAISFGLSCLDAVYVLPVYTTAIAHAMTKDPDTHLYGLTINEMRDYNTKTPEESKIKPENFDTLKGKLVLIYRYDCTDCLDLHHEILDLKSNSDVIFLSSRTKTGQAFRDYFEPALAKVPSGIYIRKDGKPVTLELYYSDPETEHVKFNYENWQRLLNVQAQDSE
jgi:hypothetical protein